MKNFKTCYWNFLVKTNQTKVIITFPIVLQRFAPFEDISTRPENIFGSHKNVVAPNVISSKIGKTCFNDVFR